MNGYEVMLTCNLTKYHPTLVTGVKGIVYNTYSRLGDRFVVIKFPSITLDIVRESLDIIDPRYIREQEEKERKLLETAPIMRNIVYSRGPRGKYYGIDFEYTENGKNVLGSCYHQERGLKLIKYLDDNKISYETKII